MGDWSGSYEIIITCQISNVNMTGYDIWASHSEHEVRRKWLPCENSQFWTRHCIKTQVKTECNHLQIVFTDTGFVLLSPRSDILYTITSFTKWWISGPSLLVNNWACWSCPFQSWHNYLVPMTLFTCQIFQAGILAALHKFHSLLLSLSQLVRNVLLGSNSE